MDKSIDIQLGEKPQGFMMALDFTYIYAFTYLLNIYHALAEFQSLFYTLKITIVIKRSPSPAFTVISV